MSVNTLTEALSTKKGSYPTNVKGTIKVVFPQNQTPSGKTVQNAILQDEKAECRVAFWERDSDLSDLTGKTIIISATKGANGRLGGITVKEAKDYKTGAPTLELSISENASIELATVSETEKAQSAPQTVRPENPRPSVTAQAAAVDARIQAPAGKASLADIVALFGQCYRSALAILPLGEHEGVAFDGPTLQALQAAAATLFIAARQEGLTPGCAKRDPVAVAKSESTQPY